MKVARIAILGAGGFAQEVRRLVGAGSTVVGIPAEPRA